MSAMDLAPEILSQLGWTSFWSEIKARVYQEVNQTRKIRPLLPITGFDADPDAVPDYTTAGIHWPGGSGKSDPLRIPPQQRLVSMQISREFQVSPQQIGDRNVALQLVTAAANRVGLAEDAILLHGGSLEKRNQYSSGWGGVAEVVGYRNLGIREENLLAQADFLMGTHESLYHPGKARTTDETAFLATSNYFPFPKEEDFIRAGDPATVLEAIVEGIERLRAKGHHGEYCAVVAPDVYREAFTPRRIGAASATLQDDYTEAPIYQIRPLLREGGFTYSSMACPHTGVVFSLGGGAITLAVPQDAHVTYVRKDRDIVLSVTERFRLQINDHRAVEKLSRSVNSKALEAEDKRSALATSDRSKRQSLVEAEIKREVLEGLKKEIKAAVEDRLQEAFLKPETENIKRRLTENVYEALRKEMGDFLREFGVEVPPDSPLGRGSGSGRGK